MRDKAAKRLELAVCIANCSLAVSMVALILSCAAVVVSHRNSRVIQEANPTITVNHPQTEAELHDQRVRDYLNRNMGGDDASELPGAAD